MAPSSSPPHPTNPLRYLLALEAALNILTALPLLLTPTTILSSILVRDTLPAPRALAQLTQYLGALLIALTVPVLYAIPDAPASSPQSKSTPTTTTATASTVVRAARAEKGRFRYRVYVALGVGEAVLIPVLVAQLVQETQKGGTPGAMRPGFLLCAIVTLADLVALRGWCVVCRPGWFGEVFEAGRADAVGTGRKKDL